MRVSISHGEHKTGLLLGKKRHTVTVSVQFSDEELHVIKNRDLGNDIILERDPPVDAKVTEVKGVGSALKVVSGMGKTVNGFHLRIKDLMNGSDTYTLTTPVEAKVYEDELIEKLRVLKSYLEGNAEGGSDKSFEL